MTDTTETISLVLPASILPMIEEWLIRNIELARINYEGWNRGSNNRPDEGPIGELAWHAYLYQELVEGPEAIAVDVPAYTLKDPRRLPPNQFFYERLGSAVIAAYCHLTQRESGYEAQGKPATVSHRLDLHLRMEHDSPTNWIAKIIHAGDLWEEYQRISRERMQHLVYHSSLRNWTSVMQTVQHETERYQDVVWRLERGQFGDMEGDFYQEEIRRIWATLDVMDQSGNSGWYTDYLPKPAGHWFGREARYRPLRKATMFWHRGWGWRLRKKKPGHWSAIIKDLFPKTLNKDTAQ